jgi:hypothetical protein
MSANSRWQSVHPRNYGEIHILLVPFSNTCTQPGGLRNLRTTDRYDPQQNPISIHEVLLHSVNVGVWRAMSALRNIGLTLSVETYSHTDIFFSCIFYVYSSLNACRAMEEIKRIETLSTCARTPCFIGFIQANDLFSSQSISASEEWISLWTLNKVTFFPTFSDRDSAVSTGTRQRLDGDRIPVEARFSVPIQTDAKAHLVSSTMVVGIFPGVKRPRRDSAHTPPPSAQVANE